MGGAQRGLWTAGLAAALGIGNPLAAQLTATADLGLAAIRYDGFLGSAAAFLVPSVRYDARAFSAAAQGNVTLFESGNSLVQGTAAGAWLSPPVARLRGEISGFGGLSAYADAPNAGYGLVRARAHAIAGLQGAWVGGGIGGTYGGGDRETTSEFALGAWLVRPSIAVGATGVRSEVRDSVYVDLSATVRWTLPGFEFDLLVGARAWSHANDEGPFAEATARIALTHGLAAMVSAGRYLSDPLRGSAAGRSFTAGLRVTPFVRRSPITADERLRAAIRVPTTLPPDAPVLVLEPATGTYAITVQAPGARLVELVADFTDWEPVTLVPAGDGSWRLEVTLGPGAHRLNLRVDGGAWIVPRGTTPQDDGFGGRVGLLVVR